MAGLGSSRRPKVFGAPATTHVHMYVSDLWTCASCLGPLSLFEYSAVFAVGKRSPAW